MFRCHEGKDYRVFRNDDKLQLGSRLTVAHTIVCENVDLSELIKMGKANLDTALFESVEREQAAYDATVIAATEWEREAANTRMILWSQEYLSAPEVKHTSNRWKPCPDIDKKIAFADEMQEISNRVYKMRYWINIRYTDTDARIPNQWRVSWTVRLNALSGKDILIDSQEGKKFRGEDAARKYLQGRKKKYAKLFAEISPEIPKRYADSFKVHGMLLPGYRVEGED